MIAINRTKDNRIEIKGVCTPDDLIDFTYAIISWFSKNMYSIGLDENRICESLVKMVAKATEETKPNETDTRTDESV